MIHKTSRLLFFIVVIAICLYVVIQNSTVITVQLTPGWSIAANTGVIMIGVFFLGVVGTFLVAAYYALKASWREASLRKRERERESFFEGFLTARGYLAAKEWHKAQTAWEQISKLDPTNMIAKLELSRALEGNGDLREALHLVETARIADPKNVEVLFRAAELHEKLKNKTAAIDNLALILGQLPSRQAARKARDLSKELGRYDDALEYQEQLENLGDSTAARAERAELEFLRLTNQSGSQPPLEKQLLLKELRVLAKRYPDAEMILQRLSSLLLEGDETDEALEVLERLVKISGQPSNLRLLIQTLVSHGEPERALAKARIAVKNLTGSLRLAGELELIRSYVSLGLLDEAEKALASFGNVVATAGLAPSADQLLDLSIIKGHCLARQGKLKESVELWRELEEKR